MTRTHMLNSLFIIPLIPHLPPELVPPGHSHGHVGVVAVAVELPRGDGVAEVGVVVVGRALARLALVAEVGKVLAEHLTCGAQI